MGDFNFDFESKEEQTFGEEEQSSGGRIVKISDNMYVKVFPQSERGANDFQRAINKKVKEQTNKQQNAYFALKKVELKHLELIDFDLLPPEKQREYKLNWRAELSLNMRMEVLDKQKELNMDCSGRSIDSNEKVYDGIDVSTQEGRALYLDIIDRKKAGGGAKTSNEEYKQQVTEEWFKEATTQGSFDDRLRIPYSYKNSPGWVD